MATMNISVPNLMREWVQIQIKGGKYASTSDYVRDLIRKDQERREKIQVMQAAITEGVESGIEEGFDMAELQKELDQEG